MGRRFEIVVSSRPRSASRERAHTVVGRLASVGATVVAALLAIALVAATLALGYLIAGLVVAVVILTVAVAMIRNTFRALRR